MAELTIKQDRFTREYVKTGNGALAARKAGYSPRTDRAIAAENLTKPHVAEAIRILRQRTAERLDISRDKVVNEIAHIGEQSHADGDYSQAIKAKELILKVQGHLVERSMNLNADVTQQHLAALQEYTDKRIDKGLAEIRETVQQRDHAPVTDVMDEPTQHNDSDRSMNVMTNATHADATDADVAAKPLGSLEDQPQEAEPIEAPRMR